MSVSTGHRQGEPEEPLRIFHTNRDATASLVPWKSQVLIANQIRGSRLEIFEENEGGNHFMFMENSQKFNRIVRDFMGRQAAVPAAALHRGRLVRTCEPATE